MYRSRIDNLKPKLRFSAHQATVGDLRVEEGVNRSSRMSCIKLVTLTLALNIIGVDNDRLVAAVLVLRRIFDTYSLNPNANISFHSFILSVCITPNGSLILKYRSWRFTFTYLVKWDSGDFMQTFTERIGLLTHSDFLNIFIHHEWWLLRLINALTHLFTYLLTKWTY